MAILSALLTLPTGTRAAVPRLSGRFCSSPLWRVEQWLLGSVRLQLLLLNKDLFLLIEGITPDDVLRRDSDVAGPLGLRLLLFDAVVRFVRGAEGSLPVFSGDRDTGVVLGSGAPRATPSEALSGRAFTVAV